MNQQYNKHILQRIEHAAHLIKTAQARKLPKAYIRKG
jgi:hypothetical protein